MTDKNQKTEPKVEGRADCPVCGREGEIRTTKKEKPYFVCEHCGCQIFARMQESCDGLRARIKKETEDDDRAAEQRKAPRKKTGVTRTVSKEKETSTETDPGDGEEPFDSGVTGTGIF